MRRIFVTRSSLSGILPFAVLSDNYPIQITSLHVGHGALGALENMRWAHIDVLVHHFTDRENQVPEGNVVGHVGPANGTEVDGIVFSELVCPVRWHVPPALKVGFGGPVKVGEIDLKGAWHGA